MGKPKAPPPPNPVETAKASTSTNVGTAISNAFLNNTNQFTPDGSLRYDVTGDYTWHDPYTGMNVNIPTFTATQELSPQQQAIKAQTDAAQFNLAGMANTQSQKLAEHLGSEIDLSAAPGAGNPDWIKNVPAAATTFADVGQQARTFADAGQQAGTFADVGQQQRSFGEAGDITRTYGPQDDFSSDRARVEESLYGRLNPQLQRERGNIEQRLADQGIRYGSAAYTSAMDDYNRQANDARLAVTAAGGGEQQRMMDMAAQRAGFQNAAQQQAYNQAQGRGQFANAAQAADFAQAQARGQFGNEAQQRTYEQALGRGQFGNAAQSADFMQAAARGEFQNAGLAQQLAQAQAGFNAQNMARNQYTNEQFALRNQPINEISSLLSGSQINNPNFVNTPNNQIPTTDVAGLINNRFQQGMDIYKQESQNWNSMMGGIMGLAGGMMKMSDEREKEDVTPMGTVLAMTPEGERKPLPISEYSYKRDPQKKRHVGPMAQDVLNVNPQAVRQKRGIKYIDTGAVMGSILKAA